MSGLYVWKNYFKRHPFLLNWAKRRKKRKQMEKRMQEGMQFAYQPNGLDAAAREALQPEVEEEKKRHGLLHRLQDEMDTDVKRPPTTAQLARRLAV